MAAAITVAVALNLSAAMVVHGIVLPKQNMQGIGPLSDSVPIVSSALFSLHDFDFPIFFLFRMQF